MLDAHQLNVFLIATETLKFTQATQKLGMSQPSVSQHIQTLVHFFQTPLLSAHRVISRSLMLTDADIALVPLAQDMVKQSIRIEETMASMHGEVFGHLLVESNTPGKYVLPPLLTKFHNEYYKVRITCQVSPQDQAIENLISGFVNFALTSQINETSKESNFKNLFEMQLS